MSTKNDKTKVMHAIRFSMESKGWSLIRLCKLAPCHAKDTVVTPFFQCWGAAARAFGSYRIEGSIGVVHQGFEKMWSSRFPGDPSETTFAVSSYIANFLELNETAYIPYEGPLHGNVDKFCAAVAKILDGLPSNEDELFHAFENGKLYERSVDVYRSPRYVGKFDAFREYVNQNIRSEP